MSTDTVPSDFNPTAYSKLPDTGRNCVHSDESASPVRYTHDSNVNAVLTARVAVAGTVTTCGHPLKLKPPPYTPVVHVASLRVAVLPFPDPSAVVVPVPSLNA